MKRLLALACAAALALPLHAEEKVGNGEMESPEGVMAPADSLRKTKTVLLEAPDMPESTTAGAFRVIETAPAGYAFDQPELLADQMVWGIAHGVRLLTLACARQGHGAAAEAGVEWQEREQPQILAIGQRLARHYFGNPDAPPDALEAVLGLKPALALPPEQLAPACATLAEALTQPRYDLVQRREELLKKILDK